MRVVSKEQIKKELLNIKGDGKNDILLDFEDIETITQNKDLLLMEVREETDDNAAYKVLDEIVSDFERLNLSFMNTDGILLCFQVNSAYDTIELRKGLDVIDKKFDNENIDNEPDIIFGLYCDDSLDMNYVKVTVFFALSKKEALKPINNPV